MTTIIDIIREYLHAHGYDGLAGAGCGCRIDALAPCRDRLSESCEPGYLVDCRGCGEYGPFGCEEGEDYCMTNRKEQP